MDGDLWAIQGLGKCLLGQARSATDEFACAIDHHIGWNDPYSARLYSERQSAYAKRFGLYSVCTPQMVPVVDVLAEHNHFRPGYGLPVALPWLQDTNLRETPDRGNMGQLVSRIFTGRNLRLRTVQSKNAHVSGPKEKANGPVSR
ncbi:MAG: hypothetical protein DMG70_02330 [Acidobacteria bacterium]|nr:MAG: hypothetical protein DMG70_02330 [Acidobacteriota bacterium]